MGNSERNIQVGLSAFDAAWDLILRQIGIASRVVQPDEDLFREYSILIVTDDPAETITTQISDFLSRGGCILYTPRAHTEMSRQRTTVRTIRSLPPTSTAHYEYHGILDLFSRVIFFENSDLVHSVPFGGGTKFYCGIDADDLLTVAVRRKSFYTPSGRMPNEIVSLRSKGTVRQLMTSLLRTMHHRQSLPFIHQWYFPGSERTIFTFRIDSDKGTQEQVEEIRALSERYSIPTTWFLDVKSHEEWIPYFRTFGGQEIALHCYDHILHRNVEQNVENFSKALSILRQHGITPQGITAPTGGWNNGYAESIRQLGFSYSSEFSYDYDDLPSFPVLNGAPFPIPQLPVHPVCVGTMLRARMNDQQMAGYFRSVIDRNVRINEPICLYQHPTHRHNEVFEEVFQYIDSLSIAKLSYADYAAWWEHRNNYRSAVRIDQGTINAIADTGNVHYRIIKVDGSEIITPLNGPVTFDNKNGTITDRTVTAPADIMRSRKFDPRHHIQNLLDWWITTTE